MQRNGRRLRTIHSRTTAAQTQMKDSIDYVGNLILKDGHPFLYLFDGSYASFSNDALSGWHYYIQDYMGNNRMVVNRNGNTEQITHYYPYGGVIGGISTNETLQPYKFEGKELDRTFGLDTYDVHARNYFAMLPMWDRVDPLCEKYYGISPYVYCMGNPVKFVDPDGRDTYLYATTLPGGPNWLNAATHTFLVVTGANGNVRGYFAYGSEYDGVKGSIGGQLGRRFYNQDKQVIREGHNNENLKNIIKIPVPAGLTSEEFDQKVIDVANSFGNNSNITYFMAPFTETQGNCNTSTSTILQKSGVSTEDMEDIKEQIPGISTGFNTDTTKPWTKEEQKDAVKRNNANDYYKEVFNQTR